MVSYLSIYRKALGIERGNDFMSKKVNVTVFFGDNFDYVLNKSYDFIMAETRKDEKTLANIKKRKKSEKGA